MIQHAVLYTLHPHAPLVELWVVALMVVWEMTAHTIGEALTS